MLNPGHTEKSVGAVRGTLQEYTFNEFQAQVLQKTLADAGHQVTVMRGENLSAIGQASKGYDVFISLHLNACNKSSNYTCCCVQDYLYHSTNKSAAVASKCAIAMGTALGLKIFDPDSKFPGVRKSRLRVLTGTMRAQCPVAFLSEPFFMDCYTDPKMVYNLCEVAMIALAKTILSVEITE